MNKVLIEVSARHIHLSREHLDILFGAGYQLTVKKELSQPGQYACNEKVRVEGPKGAFAGVSVLGPERPATQLELSLTDARSIGLKAPVRESGDTKGSGGCKLVGPCGEVELTEGVIAAKRHIHVHTDDAKAWGLEDRQVVSVKVETDGRSLVFGDTFVRVSDKFSTSMHIDTDEANAAGVSGEVYGEIIA